MKTIINFLKKICVLHAWPTILISVPSFLLLIGYFLYGKQNEEYAWLAIPVYVLSAYALTIVCTGIVRIIQNIRKKLSTVGAWNLYWSDIPLRTMINMVPSLIINVFYIGSNFWLGYRMGSHWFVFLGIYYLILVSMKGYMLRGMIRRRRVENRRQEYINYRNCGISLLLLNFAMIAMAVYIVKKNQNYSYSGFLIYGMAAVAFYNITMAIINVIKHRKSKNPTIFAVKVINLTTAMVSMLALETALISQFGEDTSATFRNIMTSISAGVVCLVEFILAIRMIYKGFQYLKE